MADRALRPEFAPQPVYTLRAVLGPQDDAFGDFGVAAGGLAVGQHDDGRAGGGHLDGPEGDAVGDNVRRLPVLDGGAAQAAAHMMGPKLRFDRACVIAITGGDLGPTLDGQPIRRQPMRSNSGVTV